MAEASQFGSVQDEGLAHLESFLALLKETRQSLGERQAALEVRADAVGQQAAVAAGRLGGFHETVTGLAESFATTSQATAADLGRLAVISSDLAEQVRGAVADALRGSEARFTAAIEASRASLEHGAARLAEGFGELEQAIERGDANTAATASDHEEGFAELGTTVAEADSSFSQADFDLQGMLETTVTYLGEGLERYLVTVFNTFYDHLQNELPPLLTALFQDLGRTVHRALDEYDSLVESISGEMAAESESQMKQCVRTLREALDDREDDRRQSLDEMRTLLQEAERCTSTAGRGSDICAAYPPIVPMLAAAREVADRVQEMMDVFNPFGG